MPLFWKNMTRLCSSMSYIFHLRFCLRECRRKNSCFFRCGAFLSCVVDEMLIEVPLLHKNLPCPEKFLVVPPDKFILILNVVLFLLHICFFWSKNFENIKQNVLFITVFCILNNLIMFSKFLNPWIILWSRQISE